MQAVFEYDGIGENTGSSYHYCDIQNSTRFITDSLKNIVQENIFDPFGQELITTENPTGGSLDYKYATHSGVDKNTGLTYMTARWMDNVTGRFISPDVMKQGVNYYVYCGNNPTTMIDPDGNWFGIDDLIVLAIAMNNAGLGGGDYGETIENYFKEYYAKSFQMVLGGPLGIIGGITYEIGNYYDNDVARSVGLAFTGFGIGGITGAINGGIAGYNDIYDFSSSDFFGNGIGAFFVDSIDPLEFGMTYGYLAAGTINGGQISKDISKGSGQLWMTDVNGHKEDGYILGHTYLTGWNEQEVKDRIAIGDKWGSQWQAHERQHSIQSRLFGFLFPGFYYATYGIHIGIKEINNYITRENKPIHFFSWWEWWALHYYPME